MLGKFLKGSIQIDAVRGRRHLQRVDQTLRRRAGAQSAIEQRLRPISDHFRGIEIVTAAEAVALRASSIQAVEGKRARLQLRHADAAIRTSQLLGIKLFVAADHSHLYQASRQLHRVANRLFQPVLNPRLYQEPVHHNFDGVVLAFIEVEIVLQIDQFAVNAGTPVAVLEH